MRGGFVPGDVADVLNEYGVWNRAIYSVKPEGFVWQYGVADSTAPKTAEARPLVVIDPEDREQVEAVARAILGVPLAESTYFFSTFQAALRRLIADPKPDEPTGLGAVVEDEDGRWWSRLGGTTNRPWHHGIEGHAAYADIDVVRVLSEGVST